MRGLTILESPDLCGQFGLAQVDGCSEIGGIGMSHETLAVRG